MSAGGKISTLAYTQSSWFIWLFAYTFVCIRRLLLIFGTFRIKISCNDNNCVMTLNYYVCWGQFQMTVKNCKLRGYFNSVSNFGLNYRNVVQPVAVEMFHINCTRGWFPYIWMLNIMKITAKENDINILQTFHWNVCNMSLISFSLAVIFIIRLFSTSAFREPNVE